MAFFFFGIDLSSVGGFYPEDVRRVVEFSDKHAVVIST
jgi:hypothetical protein